MQRLSTPQQLPPIEQIRKVFLLANGALLTLTGIVAGTGDLVAYWTGNGPLGKHLFNAPYAVSFFEVHGLTAFFGILILTMARSNPKPAWHIAAAAIHLFSAIGIAIFWQGAVEWNVASAEASVAVVDVVLASAHLLLYTLARRYAAKGDVSWHASPHNS